MQVLTARPTCVAFAGQKSDDIKLAIKKIFVFSYAWAIGGHLVHTVRDDFDEFAREQLSVSVSPIHAQCSRHLIVKINTYATRRYFAANILMTISDVANKAFSLLSLLSSAP